MLTTDIALRSARDRRRTRRVIRLAAVVRLAGGAVDVDEDAGVGGTVRAGEADRLPRRERPGAGDLDLGARLVELRRALVAGRVQGEHLDAQEVLPRGDALRQVEVDPAVVVDQVVDAPFLAAGVEPVLPDLEPVSGVVLVLGDGR